MRLQLAIIGEPKEDATAVLDFIRKKVALFTRMAKQLILSMGQADPWNTNSASSKTFSAKNIGEMELKRSSTLSGHYSRD